MGINQIVGVHYFKCDQCGNKIDYSDNVYRAGLFFSKRLFFLNMQLFQCHIIFTLETLNLYYKAKPASICVVPERPPKS